MKKSNLVQGSPEWLAHRAALKNASEASMMMGAHSSVSRDEFIRLTATASEQEFSDFVQRRVLDVGHEVEALARPIVEDRIGEDLFPVVGTSDDGVLGASLDGLTFDGSVSWECKQMNQAKLADVQDGRVPECDRWQVVQQLVVSGAEKSVYTVSDGTEENTFSVEYRLAPDDEKRLRAGWAQFDADVADYAAKLEAGEVETHRDPVAEVIEDLPAVQYKMDGLSLSSNMAGFKSQARALIEKSKKTPETDDDFATSERLIKVFKSAEDALGAKVDQVLGEISDVDKFSKEVKAIREEIRQARLAAQKQVDAEKDRRRVAIRSTAIHALSAFLGEKEQALEEQAGIPVRFPEVPANFAGAMKGKRNLSSIQSAVNDELARAKIEADQIADRMSDNLTAFQALADGYAALFPDLNALLPKGGDDFSAVVKARIADHEAEQKAAAEKAEADRLAAEAAAAEKAESEKPETANEAPAKPAKPAGGSRGGRSRASAPARPSDAELIDVVAKHYGVSADVAAGWLESLEVAA